MKSMQAEWRAWRHEIHSRFTIRIQWQLHKKEIGRILISLFLQSNMACCRVCSNGYEVVFGLYVCTEVNKLVEVGQTEIMIMCGRWRKTHCATKLWWQGDSPCWKMFCRMSWRDVCYNFKQRTRCHVNVVKCWCKVSKCLEYP